MIRTIQGDILNTSGMLICHQVNCNSQITTNTFTRIKEKYPEAYEQYLTRCRIFGPNNLGDVQFCECNDGHVICHLYIQNLKNERFTQIQDSYLEECLIRVEKYCLLHGCNLVIPYGLGCNNSDGNWNDILKVIQQVFNKSIITCYICHSKNI